jgi:hypothetical protein
MLKQCKFCYAMCLNKLNLVVVCAFKVDDQGYDEEPRDFNEQPIWVFLLLVVCCMLLGECGDCFS